MFFLVAVGCVFFFAGLVVLIQGFVGKEPYRPSQMARPGYDPFGIRKESFGGAGGMDHPPERHPVRLMLIGLALLIVGCVIVALAV
jgi:hypothetical protein